MTTEKQIAANQANALKSTGPKTTEGRERSKMNALKHGLTASEVTCANETVDDFNAYYDEFIEILRPVGAIEEQLAERIIICAWRLRRVYRIDSSLFVTGRSVGRFERAVALAEQIGRDELRGLAWGNPTPISEAHAPQVKDIKNRKLSAALGALEESGEVQSDDVGSVGGVFLRLAGGQDAISKLTRYEAAIERSYQRARQELERLQARRRGEAAVAGRHN
jgi:hypothetical protein